MHEFPLAVSNHHSIENPWSSSQFMLIPDPSEAALTREPCSFDDARAATAAILPPENEAAFL